VKPRSLEEALDALARHGEAARLLAGGQSLVPALNMRLLEPRFLIDINGIAALTGIVEEKNGAEEKGGLRLGALTRHVELGASPLVARLAPLLHRAVPHIAHPAIRNRGTLGGSLAQADPAAELPACAVALDAAITVQGRGGTRRIAARDFYRGLYETALAPHEMITAVEIPPPAPRSVVAFLELARRRGDYAIAGLAAIARLARGDATVEEIRLVYLGVGGMPVEAKRAARLLAGKPFTVSAAAEEALDEDLDPPDDLNATGPMKRHLARVLLRRAMASLAQEAAALA
jgi:aerobic carbon-monoxide dehydrogenase medium subunit